MCSKVQHDFLPGPCGAGCEGQGTQFAVVVRFKGPPHTRLLVEGLMMQDDHMMSFVQLLVCLEFDYLDQSS